MVLLCLLRFQVLNTGVVKTGEMRRVKYVVFFSALSGEMRRAKCVVFFSALYNSKHVFNKLNVVVLLIQV